MIETPVDMISGTVFLMENHGELVIAQYNGCYDVDVVFTLTGYKCNARAGNIRRGQVRDPFYPTVCGVGCLGLHKTKAQESNPAYRAWHSMITRCYSDASLKKNPTYMDCYVCDEWKLFSNFEGWYFESYPDDGVKYELDKDFAFKGNRKYSPDTCRFITKSQNLAASHGVSFKLVSPSGEVVEGFNLREFCRKHSLNNSQLSRLVRGLAKSHKGWTRYAE